MNKGVTTTMQTLMGIVTPCNWDEHDRVSEVSLSATDDEEYIIVNSERFLDLVQKPIRATGTVKRGRKIHRTIDIKKYRVLDYATLFEQVHPEYSRAIGGSGFAPVDQEEPSYGKPKRSRYGKKGPRLFSPDS
jgi:hypothetical protein